MAKTMVWTNLGSSVVSNCEIAGLINARWTNHPNTKSPNPNGDANFFDGDNQLIAIRRDNRLQVLVGLLPRLTSVRGK